MNTHTTRKLTTFVVPLFVILYAGMGLFSEYWIEIIRRHGFGGDFLIYYQAYTRAMAGENPYLPYDIGSSFIYHPFALLFVGLFSWHHYKIIAYALWTLLSALAWMVSIFIASKITKWDVSLYPFENRPFIHTLGVFLVAVLFAPFLETLHVGQINTFVILLVCLSVYLAERKQVVLAGFCLALGIIFKTSVVVIVIYFVLLRHYRAIFSLGISLIGLSLLSSFIISSHILRDFALILPMVSSEVHVSTYNQSIVSVALQYMHSSASTGLARALATGQTIIFGIVCAVVLIYGFFTKEHSPAAKLWLLASLTSILVFFSPLVWYHHAVLLLVPMMALARHRLWAYRFSALALLLLLQMQRFIEYTLMGNGLVVVVVEVLVMIIAIHSYFKEISSSQYMAASPVQV